MTAPHTLNPSPKKIIIAGGTGQLGQILARVFDARGHDITVLTRSAPTTGQPWSMAQWDGVTQGRWVTLIDGADVVINLAGKSVDCRYTEANRRAIIDSRIASTRAIGEAIAAAAAPPPLWLQASTATIYGHRYDAPNDEATGWIGRDAEGADPSWQFSVEVAKVWEATLAEAQTPHTRKVALRTSMVMSPDDGGIFDVMRHLVSFGLGGKAGDGRQYVSWIHDVDFVRAIDWIMQREHLEGPINLAAPNPVPNAEFMRALRHAWGAPIGLPATTWMLELGTWVMRTETELVLKSRRVVPGVLEADGFTFAWPAWEDAARDLCTRWRHRRDVAPMLPYDLPRTTRTPR